MVTELMESRSGPASSLASFSFTHTLMRSYHRKARKNEIPKKKEEERQYFCKPQSTCLQSPC